MQYEVTVDRVQGRRIISSQTTILTTYKEPKIGDVRALLVRPLMHEIIVAVKPLK